MTGRSRIERFGLGEKILAYWSADLSYDDICRKVALEHADARVSKSQISRYLALNAKIVAALKEEKKSRQIELTAQSAKNMLIGLIHEVNERRKELREDPRMWAVLTRLKFDLVDKVLKVTGTYAVENDVKASVTNTATPRQPRRGEPRCPDCAYGLIFRDGLDIRVIEQDPRRCEGCPYRGKFHRDEIREGLEDRSRISPELFTKIMDESKEGVYGCIKRET
jgi:hypothetical protein